MSDGPVADVRTRHPFHSYDEILAQPLALDRTVRAASSQIAPVVKVVQSASRVFVMGDDISDDIAGAGTWILRLFTSGTIDVHAVSPFDIALYPWGLDRRDVIVGVSQVAGGEATAQALEAARTQGAATILITPFSDNGTAHSVDHVLTTGYADSVSAMATGTYTTSLAALAVLGSRLAPPDGRLDLAPLADVVADERGLEPSVHRIAAGLLGRDNPGPLTVLLVGDGPNLETARAMAHMLAPLRDTIRAVVLRSQEVLTWPAEEQRAGEAVVVIAPHGRATRAAAELCARLAALAAPPLALISEQDVHLFDDAHRLVLPDVPEPIAAIPTIVPLQLLAYWLTVGYGRNPDLPGSPVYPTGRSGS